MREPLDSLFKPSPEAGVYHELIFSAWRCALGDTRIVYCSGPITTGKRWIEAVEAGEYEAARPHVVAQNSEDLLTAARNLRLVLNRVVVEPASLEVRSWSQDDYLYLWTELIERHAGEVRFLPHWAYSNGCAHEFERALTHGVATLELDGRPIGRRSGLDELRFARDDLARRAVRFPQLGRLAASIEQVVDRIDLA